MATAARTSILGAFSAGQGYAEDGDYSPFAWLMHRTEVTRGRRRRPHRAGSGAAAAHPAVQAALAAGAVSASYAREICRWTGSCPSDSRAGGR